MFCCRKWTEPSAKRKLAPPECCDRNPQEIPQFCQERCRSSMVKAISLVTWRTQSFITHESALIGGNVVAWPSPALNACHVLVYQMWSLHAGLTSPAMMT